MNRSPIAPLVPKGSPPIARTKTSVPSLPPPPSPPRAPPPRSVQRELADAIVRRAHAFTLPALLDALAALGLRSEEIEFRSHPSQAHHAFLIHGVQFQDDPRRAFVELNIGLLTAQSPLPSYFFSILDEGGDNSDAVLAFLGLFDHPLLRERARAEYPERDRRVVNNWEHDKALILSLMALQSPSSLHWLFQRVFPELGVLVSRRVQARALSTAQVIMGATSLGESRALGGEVRLAAGGVSLTLYCQEQQSPAGRPWAREAARRLESYILPLLRAQNLFLDVWLVIEGSASAARLAAELKNPDSFLGYDPLGRSASLPSAQKVLLFSGHTDPSEQSTLAPSSE